MKVEIDDEVIKKLGENSKDSSEFESISEYINYILEQVANAMSSKKEPEETEKIEENDEKVKERFGTILSNGKIYMPPGAGNDDLYKLADEIGIPRSNIKFTNLAGKGEWFKKHPNFEWHLEDSPKQIFDIENVSSVPVINPLNRNWKKEAEDLIKKKDIHGYLRNSGT